MLEERERGKKERQRKGKIEYKSSLLGHFGVPLPVSPAMLYFSSPSAWSTILKVISCYSETLTWLELLVSSSSSLSAFFSLDSLPHLSASLFLFGISA